MHSPYVKFLLNMCAILLRCILRKDVYADNCRCYQCYFRARIALRIQ